MIVETIGRGRMMTAMTAVGRDYEFYGKTSSMFSEKENAWSEFEVTRN